MFAPGRRVTIQCVVKGFPESKINWESSIGNFAHSTTSSRTPLKNEYTTTSIFTLDSPTVDDNGKTVDCVVVPKIGTGLRRRFALKMYYGKEIYLFLSCCFTNCFPKLLTFSEVVRTARIILLLCRGVHIWTPLFPPPGYPSYLHLSMNIFRLEMKFYLPSCYVTCFPRLHTSAEVARTVGIIILLC